MEVGIDKFIQRPRVRYTPPSSSAPQTEDDRPKLEAFSDNERTVAMTRLADAHETSGPVRRKLITAEAVAERLDVPKSTIYEAARQNRIGGVVRLGRVLRFDPDKLEAWLESGGEALPGGWRQDAA